MTKPSNHDKDAFSMSEKLFRQVKILPVEELISIAEDQTATEERLTIQRALIVAKSMYLHPTKKTLVDLAEELGMNLMETEMIAIAITAAKILDHLRQEVLDELFSEEA